MSTGISLRTGAAIIAAIVAARIVRRDLKSARSVTAIEAALTKHKPGNMFYLLVVFTLAARGEER